LKRTLTASILFVVTCYAAAVVPPGTDEEISARLHPFGSVCRAGDACAGGASSEVASTSGQSGQEIYDTFCFACHATGMSEAPKFGDAEAWGERVAKGLDTLLTNTINGINVMPPKGTCMACSDSELEAVITYIIDGSQ
jgi:cytochrome c5